MPIFLNISGSRFYGTKNPPIITEGKKISCDHNIVDRELEDATHISTPSPSFIKTAKRKTNKKLYKFWGRGALNNTNAVSTIIRATIIVHPEIIFADYVLGQWQEKDVN